MASWSPNRLCDFVRETSFAIHRYHRHGHVEKAYENALAHRLRKIGLHVVENTLVAELKSARAIVGEHVAQLLGYLRSSGFEVGLLVNFGAPVLYVKKYLLTPRSASL